MEHTEIIEEVAENVVEKGQEVIDISKQVAEIAAEHVEAYRAIYGKGFVHGAGVIGGTWAGVKLWSKRKGIKSKVAGIFKKEAKEEVVVIDQDGNVIERR